MFHVQQQPVETRAGKDLDAEIAAQAAPKADEWPAFQQRTLEGICGQ
jgi:hypothetical protein